VEDDERGVVHVLLENGADPDRKNNKCRTARALAKKYGNKKILQLIEAFDENDEDRMWDGFHTFVPESETNVMNCLA
jgi:ankyrin repeat protein